MKRAPNWLIIATTTVACVLFAVLAWISSLFASLCFTATWILVAGACVAAFVRTGRSVAFWRGFAALAFLYFFGTVLVGDFETAVRQVVGTTPQRPHLASSYFLAWAYDKLGAPEIWTAGGTRIQALHLLKISRAAVPTHLDITSYERFMCVGQCVFTLLMGLCGGWIGQLLYERSVAVRAERLARA